MADDRLREALKKDFNKLYVKGYTTTWEIERIKIGIEIDIMSLENTASILQAENRPDVEEK